jgi:hypothetical protein
LEPVVVGAAGIVEDAGVGVEFEDLEAGVGGVGADGRLVIGANRGPSFGGPADVVNGDLDEDEAAGVDGAGEDFEELAGVGVVEVEEKVEAKDDVDGGESVGTGGDLEEVIVAVAEIVAGELEVGAVGVGKGDAGPTADELDGHAAGAGGVVEDGEEGRVDAEVTGDGLVELGDGEDGHGSAGDTAGLVNFGVDGVGWSVTPCRREFLGGVHLGPRRVRRPA